MSLIVPIEHSPNSNYNGLWNRLLEHAVFGHSEMSFTTMMQTKLYPIILCNCYMEMGTLIFEVNHLLTYSHLFFFFFCQLTEKILVVHFRLLVSYPNIQILQ